MRSKGCSLPEGRARGSPPRLRGGGPCGAWWWGGAGGGLSGLGWRRPADVGAAPSDLAPRGVLRGDRLRRSHTPRKIAASLITPLAALRGGLTHVRAGETEKGEAAGDTYRRRYMSPVVRKARLWRPILRRQGGTSGDNRPLPASDRRRNRSPWSQEGSDWLHGSGRRPYPGRANPCGARLRAERDGDTVAANAVVLARPTARRADLSPCRATPGGDRARPSRARRDNRDKLQQLLERWSSRRAPRTTR